MNLFITWTHASSHVEQNREQLSDSFRARFDKENSNVEGGVAMSGTKEAWP
jgi:hypothetical protein